MKIGDVTFYIDRKKKIRCDCDCENCIMGWDVTSYEGECEDYGCYFNYDFDVPLWKCLLPYWIKRKIKRKYER